MIISLMLDSVSLSKSSDWRPARLRCSLHQINWLLANTVTLFSGSLPTESMLLHCELLSRATWQAVRVDIAFS